MPFVFTIQNQPNEGDIVSVSLTDGDGETAVYEYTVQSGDSLASIVDQLAALINAGVLFTAVDQTTYPGQEGLQINQVTTNNYNLFTGFVVITITPDLVDPAYTMAFDEINNAFEGERSYLPEWMSCVGTLFITFKNGSPWSHNSETFNNFYGVQYGSFVVGVGNDGVFQKKTWISLSEVSNKTWTAPLVYTNLMSYGSQPQESNLIFQDFRILEGQPSASFRRDLHSIGGIINGDTLKGSLIVIKFEVEAARANEISMLTAANVKFIESPLNVR